MKLLLDEMWSAAIAVALRRRNHDVIAIAEPDHHPRYGGMPDEVVFARAQEDGRTIVTDNVSDFERVRLDWEERGRTHHGVVYALDPPFNRHRSDTVIGTTVVALDQFLSSLESGAEPFSRVHWLRSSS